MLHLDWPWMMLLLPLAVVFYWLLPAAHESKQAALKVPTLTDFQSLSQGKSAPRRQWWQTLLLVLIWLALLLAASRPVWVGDKVELPVSGRDMMLAVDLSESMLYEDFEINDRAVNRLVATKHVAEDFIQRREGDRLGLILFGLRAYLQTPLTFDLSTVNTLLQEAQIGLAGKQTAIGDAIGLAIKRLKDKQTGSRVLILMTDGQNTAGEIEPLKAAEIAAQHGLKIYTIGIGANEIIRRGLFGNQRINPSRDLDEKTLTAIAEMTGGQYFRASDTAGFAEIYQTLDQLEQVEVDSKTFRPEKSLFMWPAAVALLLTLLLAAYRFSGRAVMA